ncbi:MAG: HTH-type transcriptional regulator MurR [Anaerolineales bacterium]|nr:HTH-type transcriptional regulator MurR [Anaerolineales bacterium]
MAHSGSLEDRITSSLDSFSRKQRRLARFMLDNKYFVSFASAGDVGDKVEVSAATVVRFAQGLGYEGFSELQTAIREELPSYLTAVERMGERLSEPPATDDVPQSVFHSDINNIERTANALSASELDAVLDEMVRADHILVVGSGISMGPALFLTHSLKVIGMDARAALDGGLSLAVDTAQLEPSTLLIAIDLWRYVRSTVEAVYAARQQGVPIVTITDSVVSPLAQAADYAFEVATDGVTHSLSPTAVITLINVLIAGLSYRAPEQRMEALRRVDAAYRKRNLLIVE